MKTFVRKLSSRKLWAAIVGVAVGIAAAFGIDGNDWAEIAGIVTSAASVISYIFAEGSVDAARESSAVSINN
jgi:phage shock protein PspC (stress-responsive transcriptional regulator)